VPEPTPEQQQAQERMADWMAEHQDTTTVPGLPGAMLQVGATVQTLLAAAGAGQIAVAPDIGEAINKQLTEVERLAEKLQRDAQRAAVDPQFGGGYAEQVGRFVQQVAAGGAGSAEEVLTKFRDELGLFREAVARSMQNYRDMDESSADAINNAGGQS
jgi:hypothetical protein